MSHGSICSAIVKIAKFFYQDRNRNLERHLMGSPDALIADCSLDLLPMAAVTLCLCRGVTPLFSARCPDNCHQEAPLNSPSKHLLSAWSLARLEVGCSVISGLFPPTAQPLSPALPLPGSAPRPAAGLSLVTTLPS